MTVQEQVREFHETFRLAIASRPMLPNEGLRLLRVELLAEEVDELMRADEADDLVEIADALGDIVYVIYGTALSYGIDLDRVVAEIHRSNMTKEPGPTGKAVKGVAYDPPRIAHVLVEQP